ncbi:hypothetical protein [Streptomyces sp. NPDC006285]|uniref:hypothetical protein n=1 Tax=Streptomyces sp. NPDC006285 TaxID=3364742 RepID=UPI003678555A
MRVVDRLRAVGVADKDVQEVAAGVGEPHDAAGKDVAAGQPGQRVPAGGVQLAAHTDVVRNDGQSERHGGRGDEECARVLP